MTWTARARENCSPAPALATGWPWRAWIGWEDQWVSYRDGRHDAGARDRTLSLEEEIDTSPAAGELVFHVFGAIARCERRLVAERTKDGIAAARARGKRPGRKPVDTERMKGALKRVAVGFSPSIAARAVGIGRSTVYRELSRAGSGMKR